jgi:hypothetical protein
MDTNATNGNGGTKYNGIQFLSNNESVQSRAEERRDDKPTHLEKVVQDYVSDTEGRFIPEKEKWASVKELYNLFSRAVEEMLKSDNPLHTAEIKVKHLENDIEKSKNVDALGDINMQGLRYIVSILEKKAGDLKKLPAHERNEKFKVFLAEYSEICKTALESEDYTSEPVREQIFRNLCNALSIPAYPLEKLDKLYDDFKNPEKRKGRDMAEEMNRDIQDEIDNQPGITINIEQQNTFWDTKRIQFFRKSEDEKEVVGREWDFWKTMTEKRFLLRYSKIRSLKNLIDGKMSLDDMKKEMAKLSEIRSWKMD